LAATVVICFTDIVGSTTLLKRVGDDAFDALRRSHFDLLGREVVAQGGEIVKHLGDGAMIAFGSASDAVAAAVSMQRAVEAAARRQGEDAIAIRIGISAGDAVQEGDDWFGAPVVEGARLCTAAGTGQILVSEVVRLLAGSRGGHEFRSLGELELRGIPEPLATSEVVWAPAPAHLASSLPGALTASDAELPFSGRAAATSELDQAWSDAQRSGPRLAMIAGEPGVGKTRLVSEFARRAWEAGAIVLLGRADEHVDAPYGPWREAMRSLVRAAPDEVLAAHVADFGGALARLVPELSRRVDGVPAPAESDPDTERLMLFEAVAALLVSASEAASVVLVLDDVHWADRSSLLLLLHLLRLDRPAAVLVVATYRDTDVDRSHALSTVLADLRRLRSATRISLGGLDGEGVVELLTTVGGHELDADARAFAATLLAETDGNPFFLGEVLRHLIESGGLVRVDGRWRAGATLAETGLPEGVREVIGRRLAGLPDTTNAVLGAASVLGREFDVAMVAAVAQVAVEEVFEALAPAEAARLIEAVPARPGRYSFAHALVRTTLVDELGTNRRIRLHRAAGLALEALSEPPIGELAYHFGEAAVMGETDRAVRYAKAAALQALDLAAPVEAATLARRALSALDLGAGSASVAERVELLFLLGRALTDAGALDFMDAVAAAFEAAAAAGDWGTAAEAAILFGAGMATVAREQRALDQIDRALANIAPGDSELRALLLARSATWRMIEPGDRAALEAAEAHAMALRVGSDTARERAATAVSLTFRNIDRERMLASAEEALQLRHSVFSSDTLFAHVQRMEALLGLGDLAGLEAALDAFARDFESSPVRAVPGQRANMVGTQYHAFMTIALVRGDLDEVERLIAEADADPRKALNPVGFGFAIEFGRTQVAYYRGEWAAATEGWARTRDIVPGAIDVYFGFTGAGCALTELREYVDAWLRIDAVSPNVTKASNVTVVAEALRRLGDREASAAYAERFTGHAGYIVTNTILYGHGPYDTGLGILFTTAGQLDRAVEYLEAAVQCCDAIGSASFAAIAQLELATTLRLRDAPGDAARSAALTEAAHRATTQMGMHGWARRAERLAAGDREPWRIEADA
jgi:class 3 adenylate cyclase